MSIKSAKIFAIVLGLCVIAGQSFAAGSDVNLNINESRAFNVPAVISRVLSANQDIAIISNDTDNSYKITGVSLGTTYVYIWWEDENYSVIKVTVKNPVPTDRISVEQAASNKQRSLKFELTGSSYGGESNSQYSFNRWAYGGFFTGLKISGDTPLGQTASYVNYEGYNGSNGITRFSLNFKGEDYYFDAGDGYASFSETTLPYLHYQGLQLRKDFSKQLSLAFVGGARGNGYWGKDALRDNRPVQKFAAVQTTFKPSDRFSLDFRAVTSSMEGTSTKTDIFGVGAKYKPFDQLSVAGEISKNLDSTAWLAETSYFGPRLYLRGVYKNIPAGFVMPYDTIDPRGIEGAFLYGHYSPFNFLRLSAQGSRYLNTYMQGAASNVYNKDLNANLDIIVNPSFTISYAPWQQDHRGFPNGGLGEGAVTQASYSFRFLGFSNIFLRYEPSKFTYSVTSETDYQNDKMTVGTRIGLSESLYMDLENEWSNKTILQGNSSQPSRFFKIIVNYDSRIGKTPFYTVMNSRYYNGTDPNGLVSELWLEAELGYKPSDDTKLYIKGKTADYRGSGLNTTDRQEKHITCGFNTVFDSGFVFDGSGKVSGYVFNDKNGNGIKDRLEEGIADAKVFVKDKYYVLTDKSGRYEITALKQGQSVVGLDMNSVNPKYMLTTQNPQALNISSGKTSSADFGLKTMSAMRGRVFIDKNGNNRFDQSDKPISNFAVFVNDKEYLTDFEGKYYVYDIDPGRQMFVIKADSLPEKLLPTVPLKNYVEVSEGSVAEYNVPLKPVQAIGKKAPAKKTLKKKASSRKTVKKALKKKAAPAKSKAKKSPK